MIEDLYQSHVFYDVNKDGRDFVVGDIHGFINKFTEKLNEVEFNPEVDRMFSVGDLIDRGPHSLECLSLLQKPWFHAVLGNHEQMMIDSLDGDEQVMDVWEGNGGKWHRDVPFDVLNAWVDELETLPLAITVNTDSGQIGITHANPPEDWEHAINRTRFFENLFLWGRTKIMHRDSKEIENIYMTVHGHTPTAGVQQFGNSYFIDTLRNGGGELTFMRIQ